WISSSAAVFAPLASASQSDYWHLGCSHHSCVRCCLASRRTISRRTSARRQRSACSEPSRALFPPFAQHASTQSWPCETNRRFGVHVARVRPLKKLTISHAFCRCADEAHKIC